MPNLLSSFSFWVGISAILGALLGKAVSNNRISFVVDTPSASVTVIVRMSDSRSGLSVNKRNCLRSITDAFTFDVNEYFILLYGVKSSDTSSDSWM